MNSRWSKNVIRSAVPLSRVIADLTGQQPGKRGRETLVRCPFHHDTKPSLRINDEKGVWTCDPCGVGGDHFKFVMQLEDLTFPESLAFLGNRYQAGSVAQQGPGRGGPTRPQKKPPPVPYRVPATVRGYNPPKHELSKPFRTKHLHVYRPPRNPPEIPGSSRNPPETPGSSQLFPPKGRELKRIEEK